MGKYSSGQACLKYMCAASGSPLKVDLRSPEKDHKDDQGVGALLCEDRLEELWLFSLEKKGSRETVYIR